MDKLNDKLMKNLIKEYSFVGLSAHQLEELIEKEYKKLFLEKACDDGDDLEKLFVSRFSKMMDDYVRRELVEKKAYYIIDNYVLSHIDVSVKGKKNLRNLVTIVDYFEKIGFLISEDEIVALLKENKVLVSIIEKACESYMDTSGRVRILNFVSSDLAISLILGYGNLKNVDVSWKSISDDGLEKNRVNVLTAKETNELISRAQSGDAGARNFIIENNLSLIWKVAHCYRNGSSISLEDLFQEGVLGMIKAIERFDLTKEIQFSTYAYFWIRQSIVRFIKEKGKNMRLPDDWYSDIKLYNVVSNQLEEELGRSPKIEEIVKQLDWSYEKGLLICQSLFGMLSLNDFINEDGEDELIDFVSDSKSAVEDIAVMEAMKEDVRRLLENSSLSEREMLILKMRYGFIDGIEHSYGAIGKNMNISQQRVGQILQRALKKLRGSFSTWELLDYVDVEKSKEKDNFMKESKERECFMKKKRCDVSNIYRYFYEYGGYSKKEVDIALKMLPKEDMDILRVMYVGDFEKATFMSYVPERRYIVNMIFPKMKRYLKTIVERNLAETLIPEENCEIKSLEMRRGTLDKQNVTLEVIDDSGSDCKLDLEDNNKLEDSTLQGLEEDMRKHLVEKIM